MKTTVVDLALGWLVHSDVRHADRDQPVRGGVNRGYNWRQRSYSFIYSEITGYAVSTFVNTYRWTDDESYVPLARQSADFLLGIQGLAEEGAVCGAIPHS